MYKLPKEIKEILALSLIVIFLVSIILIFINPILIIFYVMGYIASVINMLRINYQVTSMLYKVVEKKKFGVVISNMFGLSLYFIVLLIGFYLGVVEGFVTAIGVLVIKIVIILSSILVKDGDCN